VLRPIHEAVTDTTDDALFPTLAELKHNFFSRLDAAVEQANERLDALLDEPVAKVSASMHGRELASADQLDAMLKELDDRIRPLLKDGKRVRIV
jgi:hypothetical protein